MFCGWIVNGKVQQDPPPEFWDRLDAALRAVLGITIRPDDDKDDKPDSAA